LSFITRAVNGSSNDSRSITWHSDTPHTDREQNRPVLVAGARESLVAQAYQSTGRSMLQQVGRRLGARRFIAQPAHALDREGDGDRRTDASSSAAQTWWWKNRPPK